MTALPLRACLVSEWSAAGVAVTGKDIPIIS